MERSHSKVSIGSNVHTAKSSIAPTAVIAEQLLYRRVRGRFPTDWFWSQLWGKRPFGNRRTCCRFALTGETFQAAAWIAPAGLWEMTKRHAFAKGSAAERDWPNAIIRGWAVLSISAVPEMATKVVRVNVAPAAVTRQDAARSNGPFQGAFA